MGINACVINGAAVNASCGGSRGVAPAERFCRPAAEDVYFRLSPASYNIVRPSDDVTIERQPAFGRCRQEDSCS